MPQSFGSLGLRSPTPVVRTTLIVLLAAFVVTALAVRVSPAGAEAYGALVLEPAYVLHGHRLWTLLTFGLLHDLGDAGHLLFNGLAFYFFGNDLEELWGKRRFITFMGLAQLAGGLFVVGVAALGISDAPVVGFSAVVMGVIIAWGLTFPDREMFFFFFRLRGIILVYITVGFEVLNAVSLSRVSAAAHFGGMAAGAAFVLATTGAGRRFWLKLRLKRLEAQRDGLKSRAGRRFDVIQGGKPPTDKRFYN
jgi:membrane associated rhomboid family serine protease